MTLYFKGLKIVKKINKILTAALKMENSSYLSDDELMTSQASDCLEVKSKIIIKNEDNRNRNEYIERLETDDWRIQNQCS